MKRIPILGALALVASVMMLIGVGCSPKTPTPAPGPGAKGAGGTTETPKKRTEITTPTEGTVKGVVMFKGTAPAPMINPKIAMHTDGMKGLCGVPDRDQLEQLWLVSKSGGVANVIIALDPPADKKYKITDELKKESKHAVHLDQPFCNFVPHVVAIWPEAQTLEAKNSAKVNHNVKVERGAALGVFNKTIAPNEAPVVIDMKGADPGIYGASCDIHTWMSAKVAVFNNPYFAVTDKDGHFSIKHVPIDLPLTVKMWHESTSKWVVDSKLTVKKGDNDLKLEIGK